MYQERNSCQHQSQPITTVFPPRPPHFYCDFIYHHHHISIVFPPPPPPSHRYISIVFPPVTTTASLLLSFLFHHYHYHHRYSIIFPPPLPPLRLRGTKANFDVVLLLLNPSEERPFLHPSPVRTNHRGGSSYTAKDSTNKFWGPLLCLNFYRRLLQIFHIFV